MVTMRDAVEAYNKRYYGGKGEEKIKKLNTKVKNGDQNSHDFFHVISSGVVNILENNDNFVERYKFLDDRGLVNRNSGIKAEILAKIYMDVFSFLEEKKEINKDIIVENLQKYILKIGNIFAKEIYNCNQENKEYSHVVQLKELIAGYQKYIDQNNLFTKDEIYNFISSDEIDFHIEKSQKLFEELKNNIHDCFMNGKCSINSFLREDVNNFKIDNFTMTEKIKLRGANLFLSDNRSR